MEQYDDLFEAAEAAPPIKDIEKRLRKLGCTKEQVRRHIEHVTKSRTEPVSKTRVRTARTYWTGRNFADDQIVTLLGLSEQAQALSHTA